jgi:hypothetical protein
MSLKMRAKYGPAGTERLAMLNHYMSEYTNNLLADFQKYILKCAIKKTGMFG